MHRVYTNMSSVNYLVECNETRIAYVCICYLLINTISISDCCIWISRWKRNWIIALVEFNLRENVTICYQHDLYLHTYVAQHGDIKSENCLDSFVNVQLHSVIKILIWITLFSPNGDYWVLLLSCSMLSRCGDYFVYDENMRIIIEKKDQLSQL